MARTDGWAFVVNPISGNGYGAACATVIKDAMARHGVSGEIALTRAKGHAVELAASFAEKGFSPIIGVGGDGTIGEVGQALIGRPGVVFGGVPAGTGNDLVHIFGFQDRFKEQDWGTLFEATALPMDAGCCNGRYFFNGMGLGFDAQVAFENYHMDNGGGVRAGSRSKYFWHVLKTLHSYKEREMLITIEGRKEKRTCFLNTIANGRRLAGGFMITPKAMADDGLLDYCTADPLSLPMRVKGLATVMNGTHLHQSFIHYAQLPGMLIEFENEVPAHLDGEIIFASRFAISVAPGAVRAIINPKGDHYFLQPSLSGSPSATPAR